MVSENSLYKPLHEWQVFQRFLNWVPPHFHVINIKPYLELGVFEDSSKELQELLRLIDLHTRGYWASDFSSFVAFEDQDEAAYISLLK